MNSKFIFYLIVILFVLFTQNGNATKLIEVLPVDNRCLMIHWQDGYIEYNWDDTTSGSCNGWDYYHTERWALCEDKDQYIAYGKPLNVSIINNSDIYKIISVDDSAFGNEGQHPVRVHRKSKVWEASHDENKPAMHHWIYIELPSSLKRNIKYSLQISNKTNSDKLDVSFIFNEQNLESPAIKISNIGYQASAPHKFADVYLWMGDGSERDFSRFTGKSWYLYDIELQKRVYSGKLEFYMKNTPEPKFKVDFTGADIWECNFSDFSEIGHYKLVIEGIGCSAPFRIGDNSFEEAFKVSMQGMFYQRMGCSAKPAGGFPHARRPLYKQGVDPEDFIVKISNKEMVTGENPDNREYYREDLSGEIASSTWGGWADAYDNDQRPNNYICVFDILLTYYLNPQAFSDNQLFIPEHDNQIPDILDEALWEIDWWLRMRDSKGGYLTGLTNITPPETINYAGAPCAWQGWCVAAGCAMLADCFRLAKMPLLQEKYTEEAIKAYLWAQKQADPMLNIASNGLSGKILKMTAALYLYNLTGNQEYEDTFLSLYDFETPETINHNNRILTQHYAAVGYLLSPRKVSDANIYSNLKASIQEQAKRDYIYGMEKSPTKAVRFGQDGDGIVMNSSEMALVAIAHKITSNPEEKIYFERGLYAEAEWTLGRNPLGLVLMTGLGSRCVTQTFAPGRRDGYPGLTPGWTPYMMRDGWKNSDDIHRCEWYTNRNYPTDKQIWPWGEHFWNSRYCVPNSEATPHQTFRQKIVLYGYLFGLNKLAIKDIE